MDCDESNCPPKKKAKLDENEEKSGLPMPVKLEKKLERLLDLTKQSCLKQSKDRVQSDRNLFPRLNSSFRELLNHNALNNWGPDVHRRVKEKCERLVELCVCVMDEDSVVVLQTLALVFNPTIKFHTFNASKMPEPVPPGSNILDKKVYARPLADPEEPRGWLVDLINRFGNLGGFLVLLSRFQRGRRNLTISMIHLLFLVFKRCHMLLTVDTIVNYFVPVIERVLVILNALTDKMLETMVNIVLINQNLSGTINIVKNLVSYVPEQEGIIEMKNLDSLRIKIIFRLLLSTGAINRSIDTLDRNFNVEQWNNLLGYFRTSWKTANNTRREKMLELIQKWIEGYSIEIVSLVLELLWDLAHSDEVSTEIMEKTFSAHTKILFFDKYTGDGYTRDHILDWLDKCVEKVKSNDKSALPALIHIKDICDSLESAFLHWKVRCSYIVIKDIMEYLRTEHDIMNLVINNLKNYWDEMRKLLKENPELNKITFMPDGRYNHRIQMQRRLQVLSCLVKNRNLSPGTEQLKQIWQCLVEQPNFPFDRDEGFASFVKLMKSNGNFQPEVIKHFLEQSVLRLDSTLLTKNGFQCFEYLFIKANKNARGKFTVDNLIGIDYLWHVVTSCPKDIARDGLKLIKEINTDVGLQLERSVSDNHKTLIAEFRNQMQAHSDALSRLMGVRTIEGDDQRKNEIVMETQKMIRLMGFIEEYIKGCRWEGNEEPRE